MSARMVRTRRSRSEPSRQLGHSTHVRETGATIATVNGNGLVTGVAAGTANIVATSEGKTAQAAITVSVVPVASVTVAPNAPTVKVGATQALAATLKDKQGNVLEGRAVAWSTSAANVATVNSTSGVVTGVAVVPRPSPRRAKGRPRR
jgi:uncharacterized protein YjdB